MPPLMLIIAGPPGVGKGTLCEHIVRDFGLVHISGGDILRDEVKRGTPLGQEAKVYMDKGELVPDQVVIRMILGRLRTDDVALKGALLDGFPRTGPQADALKKSGIHFDAMIMMHAPDAALMERSSGRRIDPATGTAYHLKFNPPPKDIISRLVIRSDDQPEKQRARIEIFRRSRDALMQAYASIAIVVNADQPIASVYAETERHIRKLQKAGSHL